MNDISARFALPWLQAGQAQKEMTHNEALATLDLAVAASAVMVGRDAPPADPLPGQCWVVGAAPTGAWAGHAGALAGWTEGGWRFVAPVEGMAVWDASSGTVARWVASSWTRGVVTGDKLVLAGQQVVGSRAAAIASPTGGSVVDAEARGAIILMLDALRHHGLVEG